MRYDAILVCVLVIIGGCALPGGPCTGAPTGAGAVATDASALYVGTQDPFQTGPLTVKTFALAACERGAPVELLVHTPTEGGVYPAILFIHGFVLNNTSYNGMLRQVASHGFVVVAPQDYMPGPLGAFLAPSFEQEATTAVAVLDWMDAKLASVAGVPVDTSRVGIAGHSRGGKIAWLVTRDQPARISALAGVDPVDGRGDADAAQRVAATPLSYSAPSLVIGCAKSGSCAPTGDNHVQFYAASPSPAWHVVALDYGHGDMLNDDARDIGLVTAVCFSNPDREPMRRLCAGLLTAHFRAALQGDASATAYLANAAAMPAGVEVESK